MMLRYPEHFHPVSYGESFARCKVRVNRIHKTTLTSVNNCKFGEFPKPCCFSSSLEKFIEFTEGCYYTQSYNLL